MSKEKPKTYTVEFSGLFQLIVFLIALELKLCIFCFAFPNN